MIRRAGIVALFVGISAAAVIALLRPGGNLREELLGSAVVLALFGSCLSLASWTSRGQDRLAPLIWLLSAGAFSLSLSQVWLRDADPVARSRWPVAAWVAALALAWVAAVIPGAGARRSSATAGWLAVLAVSAAAALLMAAVVGDLELDGRSELLLISLTVVALGASAIRALMGGSRDAHEEAGFGSREEVPVRRARRGGRHARRP